MIVKSVKELVIVLDDLAYHWRVGWAKRYWKLYKANINDPDARLKYLYRLLRILEQRGIRLAPELMEKLMSGEI